MVASAGAADTLALYLGSYPSSIEEADLDENNDADAQSKKHPGDFKDLADQTGDNKEHADEPKVGTQGDGSPVISRIAKAELNGKGDGASKLGRSDDAPPAYSAIDRQARYRRSQR
jgi:hypothetical protein